MIETTPKNDAISHFSTLKTERRVPLRQTQMAFENLSRATKEKGHVLNAKKTKILTFNDRDGAMNSASLYDVADNELIQSSTESVLLGFKFGPALGVGDHVNYIVQKASKRRWILRHLLLAGVPTDKLIVVYCAYIRSILEYATPAFHTLLNNAQQNTIERIQRISLKTIFGFQHTYSELLNMTGMATLSDRRQMAFEKFAQNAAKNSRLQWFQTKSTSTRSTVSVIENTATTTRLYNSPLFAMRRHLSTRHTY